MSSPPTREPRRPKLVHDGPYVKGRMSANGRLFEHQKEALEALAKWFGKRSPTVNKAALVVMPTGSGKTGVICCLPYYFGAAVAKEEMELDLSKPILIIAPNLAIVEQLESYAFSPENNFLLKRGIITREDCIGNGEDLRYNIKKVNSSHELKELRLPGEIILSNAQQWHERGGVEPFWKTLPSNFFSVVIVDDAHHLPAKQWKGIVDKFSGDAKICIFTATPTRYDGKLITSDILTCAFTYKLSSGSAVDGGIIRSISPTFLPFKDIPQTYAPGDSESRLTFAYKVIDRVVERLAAKNEEFLLPGDKRHQAMVVAKNISEAETIADYADNHVNVCAAAIHPKLRKRVREKVKKKLRNGEIDIIVTTEMLLEGFDHPPISIVGIATHIESNVKFQQLLGQAKHVVQSENGDLEDASITADMITHEYFQQKKLFDHYINPKIPEVFE